MRVAPHRSARKLKSAIKPIGQTRRTFLKKTSATCLAVVVVTMPSELDAQTASTPSGSWYDAQDVHNKTVEFDYDTTITAALARATGAGIPSSDLPSEDELRTHLGWVAKGKLPITLTQTVSWAEWRTAPAAPPTKYRSLAWSYGGNQFSNYQTNPPGVANEPTIAQKFGYLVQIEGSGADKFQLGAVAVILGAAVGGFVSGAIQPIPGMDYQWTCGTYAANRTTQPQSVTTTTLREETSFEVAHQTLGIPSVIVVQVPLKTTPATFDRVAVPTNFGPWNITTKR